MKPLLSNIKKNSLRNYLGSFSGKIFSYGNATHAFMDVLLYLNKHRRILNPVILMPSFIPAKLYRTVLAAGYEPRFYEIYNCTDDAVTRCSFDLNEIEKLIDENTKGIFAVHYFGYPADILPLRKIADEKNIALIEDCAHVLDCSIKEGKLGSFGDFSIFSIRKMLVLSDGGLLVINKPAADFRPGYKRRVRSLYTFLKLVQSRAKYFYIHLFNGNDLLHLIKIPQVGNFDRSRKNVVNVKKISLLSELYANIADIRENSECRRKNYKYLYETLNYFSFLKPLYKEIPAGWSPYSFPVLVDADKRDLLQRELLKAGISCGKGWPESPFENSFTRTRELSQKMLELPVHPLMKKRQLDKTINVCTDFGYKLITGYYLLSHPKEASKKSKSAGNGEYSIDIRDNVTCKVITTDSEFDGLKDEWEKLCDESNVHIFQTYEWQRIWWKYFGRDKRLNLVLFYSGNRLIGVAPFFIDVYTLHNFTIVKRLRLIGSGVTSISTDGKISEYGATDYIDVIILPGYERAVSQKLIEYFRAAHGLYDIVQLEEVSNDSNVIKSLLPGLNENGWKHKVIKGEICPRLCVPDSIDEFMKNLSSKVRYQLTKIYKSMKSNTLFETREVKTENELQKEFGEFVRLHQQRWNRQGHSGAFADKCYRLFLQEVTNAFLKKGWLNFTTAYSDNKCIAVECAFTYKDYTYDYLKAFDDQSPLAKLRPGKALLINAIGNAIDKKMKVVDFLRGGENYKFEIASEWRWTYKVTANNPVRTFNARYKLFIAVSACRHFTYRTEKEFRIIQAQIKNFGAAGFTNHYLPMVMQRLKNKFFEGACEKKRSLNAKAKVNGQARQIASGADQMPQLRR